MGYMEKYQEWIDHPFFDDDTKQELLAIQKDEKEIESRFHKDLEFGTAGLRGIIGAGTDRMNKYTVRKATQGLAISILKTGKEFAQKGVVIAYDSRHMSKEFAFEAALTLIANGIKAYVFDALRPTPELSFAVRHLKTAAGIVVTASHNPKQYNGYKVYWEDGGQLPPKDSDRVLADIASVKDIAGIEIADYEESIANGMLKIIGKEIDDVYIESIKTLSINIQELQDVAKDLKIVYTPFHGAGYDLVTRVLEETGFHSISPVPEQVKPDPDFSTVVSPNPEEKAAFKLAIDLAQKIDADLTMGTDPDADRVGVVVKNKEGEYFVLEGNQTGLLLMDYILSQRTAKGMMPENPYCISTIVSSNLTKVICRYFGVEYMEVLTGFKFFGEKMHMYDDNGLKHYVAGFEESFGYLIGSYVRDKDAVVACMMIAEMTAFYKKQGMTLYDALQALYEKYGHFYEKTIPFTLTGLEGSKMISNAMTVLRNDPPAKFGDVEVTAVSDYQTLKRKDLATGEETPIDSHVSNVLYFEAGETDWFCIRPSGTEPKIKVYLGVARATKEEAEQAREELSKNVISVIDPLLGR